MGATGTPITAGLFPAMMGAFCFRTNDSKADKKSPASHEQTDAELFQQTGRKNSIYMLPYVSTKTLRSLERALALSWETRPSVICRIEAISLMVSSSL